jgi:hypothetical protein
LFAATHRAAETSLAMLLPMIISNPLFYTTERKNVLGKVQV